MLRCTLGFYPVIENENLFKVFLKREITRTRQEVIIEVSQESREEAVLSYLHQKRKVTNKEIRALLGIGEHASRNLLKKMLNEDLIIWVGKNKYDPHQYYIIKK